MARPPSGPLGNSPRDQRDDFVGEPADEIKAGAPPRWPPKPKKITRNDFHANVSGSNASKRADRPGHFRKGGFVRGRADGGSVSKPDVEPLKVDPRGPLGTALSRTRPLGSYKGIKAEETRLPKNDPGYKSGGSTKK